MARAYSHDLRVCVLDALGAGLSSRAAALCYRVGVATVIRWATHATMTEETRAQRQGRPPGSKLDVHEAFLLVLTEGKDDITLAEVQERLRTERSVSVGLGTLWRFFACRAATWKISQRTQLSRIAPTWPHLARRGLPHSPTSILSA